LLLAATGAVAQTASSAVLPDAPSQFFLAASAGQSAAAPPPAPQADRDADGNPIPLEHQQPKRILGFMPNFRSVSAGATPHPLG
jgi:hypothetical protein